LELDREFDILEEDRFDRDTPFLGGCFDLDIRGAHRRGHSEGGTYDLGNFLSETFSVRDNGL
jgi:hypothetical protein